MCFVKSEINNVGIKSFWRRWWSNFIKSITEWVLLYECLVTFPVSVGRYYYKVELQERYGMNLWDLGIPTVRVLRTNNNCRITQSYKKRIERPIGRRDGARASNPTPFAIRSTFLETRAVPSVLIGCSIPRIPPISLIVIAPTELRWSDYL